MSNSNGRKLEVSGAKMAMDKMKMEIATELGKPDYDTLDKGNLPARIHGKIGGNMVKKMISNYEAMLAKGDTNLESVASPVNDAQLNKDKAIVKDLLQ